MNFVVVSINDDGYSSLADITWEQNKIIYANLHNYSYISKNDGFYGVHMGFEKFLFIRDIFNHYPEIDWAWFSDTDAMITNMSCKLENKIDTDYHFIISTDCHGINTGSFLIRNSKEGNDFLNTIIELNPDYNEFWDAEQRVIANMLGFPGTNDTSWKEIYSMEIKTKWKSLVKIVPQKELNSYNTEIYPHQSNLDKLGTSANWSPEDLLIHWPGLSLPQRMDLAKYYMQFANNSIPTK
jgi:hypothetical protein